MSTRARAVTFSLFVTLGYVILHHQFLNNLANEIYGISVVWINEFGFNFSDSFPGFIEVLLYPLIVSIGAFWGINWVMHWKIHGERYITIALFVSFSVFIIQVFLSSITQSEYSVLKFFQVLGQAIPLFVITYLIVLTANLINYSSYKEIPLGKAARASSYIFSLLTQYFAFFVIFSQNIFPLLKFILTFFIVLYFSYCLLWDLKIGRDKNILLSTAIAFSTLLFGLSLAWWPLSAEIISLLIVLVLYVLFGIALEIRQKVSKYIWIEYIFLFIMILIFLVMSSNWGINGDLLF